MINLFMKRKNRKNKVDIATDLVFILLKVFGCKQQKPTLANLGK